MVKSKALKTGRGQTLAASLNGGVRVNEARVLQPDIVTDNGVIYVIASVALPEYWLATPR